MNRRENMAARALPLLAVLAAGLAVGGTGLAGEPARGAASPAHGEGVAQPGRVRFLAVGDVLPDRGIRFSTSWRGVEYPFLPAAALLTSANLAFANLEGCLDSSGTPLAKTFVFRGDPAFAGGLAFAGFDILSLANNHALDGGPEGLANTRELLADKGFVTVGAGGSLAEAWRPVRIERNGLRLAFLAFCLLPPEGVSRGKAGPTAAYATTEEVVAAVAASRGTADFIVLSLHWGVEGDLLPQKAQVALAHRAVEAGADLILGHHPHVLQGVEFHRGRPILYSLGNFVFDNPREEQRQCVVFGCDFEKGVVARPFLAPFFAVNLQPKVPTGGDLARIVARVNRASQGFGVEGRLEGGVIRLREKAKTDGREASGYSSSTSDSRTKR